MSICTGFDRLGSVISRDRLNILRARPGAASAITSGSLRLAISMVPRVLLIGGVVHPGLGTRLLYS